MKGHFINCSACGGCHTGRGGQFCKFSTPKSTALTAGGPAMFSDPDAPDRDSPDYLSYLAAKISEEESRLNSFQDKSRITTMEEQLSRLQLQTSTLKRTSGLVGAGARGGDDLQAETGVAASMLSASRRVAAGGNTSMGGLSDDAAGLHGSHILRSKPGTPTQDTSGYASAF